MFSDDTNSEADSQAAVSNVNECAESDYTHSDSYVFERSKNDLISDSDLDDDENNNKSDEKNEKKKEKKKKKKKEEKEEKKKKEEITHSE